MLHEFGQREDPETEAEQRDFRPHGPAEDRDVEEGPRIEEGSGPPARGPGQGGLALCHGVYECQPMPLYLGRVYGGEEYEGREAMQDCRGIAPPPCAWNASTMGGYLRAAREERDRRAGVTQGRARGGGVLLLAWAATEGRAARPVPEGPAEKADKVQYRKLNI